MTDDPRPPSGADALIQSLAAEGQVESTGAFTVEAGRARKLLESFRLADPATFVVALLQAAVLAGARRLEAEITRNRVILTFDGTPLSFEDLDQADGALFTSRESPAGRLRVALAEGLYGAEALSPKRVTVVSGGPNAGAALEHRPGQATQVTRLTEAPAGTRITVERRSNAPDDAPAGWEPPEVERLTAGGRFAPLALLVNQRQVAEGPGLADAAFVTPIATQGLEGMAGVEDEPHPAVWLVVQHGAVIATEPLEAAPAGFLAVVQAPQVRRDLGLARAVQDEAWQAAKRAAQAGRDAVLDKARRTLSYRRTLRSLEELPLARRSIRTAFLAGAFPEHRLIHDLAVWPQLSRTGADDHVSLTALKALARRVNALCFLTLDTESLSAPERRALLRRRGILRLDSVEDGQRLEDRLGAQVECLDGAILSDDPGAGRLRRLWELLGVIGVALTLALIATAVVTLYCYSDLRDKMAWPGVGIRVLRVEAVKANVRRSKRTDVVYRVWAKYTYQVRGRTYQRRDRVIKELDSEEDAKLHLARLRDPSYRIYVDPRDPTRVLHARTDPRLALLVGGIVGIILLVLFALLVVHSLRLRRAEAQAQASAREAELVRLVSQRTARARPKRRRRKR